MSIQLFDTEQNWQNKSMMYWFDVDGVTWGLHDQNGDKILIDPEGCPVDECDALPGLLSLMSAAITKKTLGQTVATQTASIGIKIEITIPPEFTPGTTADQRGKLFSRIAQEIAAEFPGGKVEVGSSTTPFYYGLKGPLVQGCGEKRWDIYKVVNAAIDELSQGETE